MHSRTILPRLLVSSLHGSVLLKGTAHLDPLLSAAWSSRMKEEVGKKNIFLDMFGLREPKLRENILKGKRPQPEKICREREKKRGRECKQPGVWAPKTNKRTHTHTHTHTPHARTHARTLARHSRGHVTRWSDATRKVLGRSRQSKSEESY